MNEAQLEKLLETYSLEEILDALDMEPLDLLVLLSEQGYLDDLSLAEPVDYEKD